SSSGSCLSMDSSSLCEIIGRCIYIDYQWADGLGQVYADDEDQGPMYCQHDHLVYYKKGTETWGTPLNWSQIRGVSNLEKIKIKIFPNPFRDELTINSLPVGMKEITVSDQVGKVVATINIE